MKQRKLAFVIIVGLITFSIYDLYWLISTRKEMIAKGYKIPSLWRVVLYPLLLVLAAIASDIFGSAYKTTAGTVFFVILTTGAVIAWIVLWIRFMSGYCRAAEQLTNHDLTYRYGFWMGMLLYLFRVGFIWEAIMQYHYNRLGSPIVDPYHVAAPTLPQAPQQTINADPVIHSPSFQSVPQPSNPSPPVAQQPLAPENPQSPQVPTA